MAVEIIFCVLGLALAVLGVLMLLRRRWFRPMERKLNKMAGKPVAWSRLAGMALLLAGTVVFAVMLAALVVEVIF